jgi:hypothetical protein
MHVKVQSYIHRDAMGFLKYWPCAPSLMMCMVVVLQRLFFAAQKRIAITLSPNYYQKIQRFTTRKNQEEHGPDVM